MTAPAGSRGSGGWYGQDPMDDRRAKATSAVTGVEGNMAVTISSSMIAGMLVYGLLGWLLSRWFGHQPLFIAGGVLVGLGLSLYLVNARLRQMPEPGRRDGDPAARGGR